MSAVVLELQFRFNVFILLIEHSHMCWLYIVILYVVPKGHYQLATVSDIEYSLWAYAYLFIYVCVFVTIPHVANTNIHLSIFLQSSCIWFFCHFFLLFFFVTLLLCFRNYTRWNEKKILGLEYIYVSVCRIESNHAAP